MARPLSYWCSGGDIVGLGGVVLPHDEAVEQRRWYLGRAVEFTDEPTQSACICAARDLQSAIQAAEAWRRASRPLAA